MTRVQIIVASRHGGTAGIAQRLADTLRMEGLDPRVDLAEDRPRAADVDAYIVGSGVYMGQWLREAIDFVEHHAATLAARRVWFFSSGPLPLSTKNAVGSDPLTNAFGPADGPGSGGHKRIEALTALVHPRDHRVFMGAFDPDASPKTLAERVVRAMPISKGILPAGDWREWDAIEAWAREIAAELRPVAVG